MHLLSYDVISTRSAATSTSHSRPRKKPQTYTETLVRFRIALLSAGSKCRRIVEAIGHAIWSVGQAFHAFRGDDCGNIERKREVADNWIGGAEAEGGKDCCEDLNGAHGD